MKFLSLQPFIPSGKEYEKAIQLFEELGFDMIWNEGGYAGFSKGECRFILQEFDNRQFAENFMLSVNVDDVTAFWNDITTRKLDEKFGIRISKPIMQPYGKEVNIIDIAGVCWHFVEATN